MFCTRGHGRKIRSTAILSYLRVLVPVIAGTWLCNLRDRLPPVAFYCNFTLIALSSFFIKVQSSKARLIFTINYSKKGQALLVLLKSSSPYLQIVLCSFRISQEFCCAHSSPRRTMWPPNVENVPGKKRLASTLSQEVQDNIFSFCSSGDLARCARVCKSWSGSALDRVWYAQTGLANLFRTLAPLKLAFSPAGRPSHIKSFVSLCFFQCAFD